jgi:hypothetical protein
MACLFNFKVSQPAIGAYNRFGRNKFFCRNIAAETMDEAEQRAADYLLAQGYSQIVFEPDGNIPPDFCVDGRIAVEVRRLNQTFADEGLNELAIPLSRKLKEIKSSFGPPVDGRSWYVFWRFKRPLPPWKTLRKEIQRGLDEFRSRATREDQVNLAVTKGLNLRLAVASVAYKEMFVPGGYTDRQSGGFVLAEMERCIQDHVEEKTLKVAPYRSRYSEWWLLLVDYVGYGLDAFDQELFHDQVVIQHQWDKLIIIAPLGAQRGFEIAAGRGSAP